jgi:chromosome partitioning protein
MVSKISRVRAWNPKLEREIVDVLRSADLPQFATHLNERQAFKAVFARRLALDEIDASQVSGVAEAMANAERLADELADMLATTSEVA